MTSRRDVVLGGASVFFLLVPGLGLLLVLLAVVALGPESFSRLVLFSRAEGVVTQNGVPVEGAEVIQELLYRSAASFPNKSVITDYDGRFVFQEVTESAGLSRLLPGEATINQRLLIRYEGREYEGWVHGKTSFDPESELDGRRLNLVCELTTEPEFEAFHFGICRVAGD
ncbi:MAG: hypothetical protein DRJ42_22365 [Deltaproteobacteria bacterium]|nr:MAG: hypothetical protein DRJ42_22365 [Deltaproteobacteria bacterium]